MREWLVTDLARQAGFQVEESSVSLKRLLSSDGVLLTNAVAGAMLVTSCCEKKWQPHEGLVRLQRLVKESIQAMAQS